jgi:hypothetical protein
LSKNNPKEFWKLLNKGKRKKQPNIEINKLYDFFQNLNTRDICDGNNGLPEVNILQNEPINEHINAYPIVLGFINIAFILINRLDCTNQPNMRNKTLIKDNVK